MSRLRIEGLLAAFPKLIDADEESRSKQHTFIETSEVRYIYQPMDTLYLLLITNMQSNILEDLSTLRMIAKLVPEYCGGHDEETVSENAFNLLYALDEVVTPMGYKESVTYKQIEDFVKMDSAEEKLSEIIEKSKHENAQELMRKKAKEFEKQRREQAKSPNMSSLASSGLAAMDRLRGKGTDSQSTSMDYGGGNSNRAISSDQYFNNMGNSNAGNLTVDNNDGGYKNKYSRDNDSDEEYVRKNKGKKKRSSKMGGMRLGKSKQKDIQMVKDAEEIDKKTVGGSYKKLMESKSNTADEALVDTSELSPIEIVISEKLFITFDKDGGMKKFEIKGDMEVAVNDPNCTQCVIETNINPSKRGKFGKPAWRLHPRMNSSEWKKGVLCLKDSQKKFRVGRSSKTSILKWKMTTSDDEMVPMSIEFWPEIDSGNRICNVNAQYTCNKELKNVIITFPTPSSREPEINSCENGDTAFYKREREFQWILNDLAEGDEGALEYTIEDEVELEDLYPVSIHFEIQNTYCDVQIHKITDVALENEFEYHVRGTCVADKFVIGA